MGGGNWQGYGKQGDNSDNYSGRDAKGRGCETFVWDTRGEQNTFLQRRLSILLVDQPGVPGAHSPPHGLIQREVFHTGKRQQEESLSPVHHSVTEPEGSGAAPLSLSRPASGGPASAAYSPLLRPLCQFSPCGTIVLIVGFKSNLKTAKHCSAF